MIRSFLKLCWLVALGSGRIVRSCLRGDGSLAREQARLLAIVIHDDFVQLVAAVQRLIPYWPVPGKEIDRILIVKLDRIGDMACTTPVFDALRAAFPKARLDVVGHEVPLMLLEGDERIGERIPYCSWLYHDAPRKSEAPGALAVIIKLLRRRYPLVVYLRGSFPFLLLATTSSCATAKFVVGEPVVTRYLKPLERILGPIANRQPRLHVGAGARQYAEDLLCRTAEGNGPRVAIHAVATAATKMWPIDRYAAVADELRRSYDARVQFLGSHADMPVLDQIAKLCTYPHAFRTSLSLSQAVALISACDLFIGNDSGLAHVAAAVGTPIVIPWGSVNLEMARPTAPRAQCTILYHDVGCRATCPETHCVNDSQLECLTRVSVNDVIVAAGQLLKHRPERPRQSQHESALSRT